ncbi:MAG: PolC-type DNA polymerase III [Firmicutes bacterium]|nr:PolC-type DNA polymerase III [Bacillota bacterium]
MSHPELQPWLSRIDRTALPAEAARALEGARLLGVEVRLRSKQIVIRLEVTGRVPLPQREALGAALLRALLPEVAGEGGGAGAPGLPQGLGVQLDLRLKAPPWGVPAEKLVEEAWPDVRAQAKALLPRVNGILDDVTPRLVENRVELEFAADALRDVVEKAGGARILEELFRKETGLPLRVALLVPAPPETPEKPDAPAEGPDNLFDDEEPRPEAEEAEEDQALSLYQSIVQQQAEEAARAEGDPGGGDGRGKGLPEGVVRGRRIDPAERPRPLRELTEEEPGRVVIEGEVFSLETRETKTGKVLVSFAVTDYTDSLVCKFFRDPQKDPELPAEFKEGCYVRVRGRLAYDGFSRDLSLMADDVNLVPRPRRMDNAPEKRVELHLHTTMSAMDALCDPEKVVKRAVEWGHKAVAITDHGVVQAFPAASHVEVPEDFRVIYGMEAYVVDDATPVILRAPQGLSLRDAEWVVVDIETTGFNAIADDIIELGAVKLRGGEIVDRFQSFVRPTKALSREVQELTGITPEMLENAPEPAEALRAFFEFCGDGILVAHNASFDYGFLRYNRQKYLGEDLLNPVLDTLMLARSVLPHLRRFGLDVLTKELGVPLENHHRADADARTAALVLQKLLDRVAHEHPEVTQVAHLNRLAANMNVEQLKPHHVTILVQRQAGVKNLYKLVSRSHLEYFNRTPRVPRTLLEEHREGLLIGSACLQGALGQALLRGASDEELDEIAAWYDFLEVQPPSNYRALVQAGQVTEEQLQEMVRRVIALGERLGKPVVATGDVHFLDPHEEILRSILKHGIGWREAYDGPCYFRTTEEMLAEFRFLPPEVARQIVIENPNRIAERIEKVQPVPNKLFAPKLEGAEEQVREMTWRRAKEIYGDPLPELVQQRIEKELNAIIGNGYAVVYYISHLLVKKSHELGYLVGSRGSVGSSFVAWCMGITEVNALPPHYVCPDCHYVEWFADGSVGSGYDLPDKPCPRCGREQLMKEGQDIPFETFMGFKGDKVPDIDLNFSGEVQSKVQQYSIELLGGPSQVFKAGTVGTIAEKTAYGMVRTWAEETGRRLREAEVDRLARGLTGVKRTTGQHPGGMVVVPVGVEVEEVTPVQYPADDKESGWRTTHFDYHSFENALLKLDILGHDDPTMLRMLQDLTAEHPVPEHLRKGLRFLPDGRLDVTSIPMNDEKVLALFRPGEGARVLGLKEGQVEYDLGSIAIPEMGTGFVRRMLCETMPRTFSDLVRISGLSHGTDVWTNNAQELIRKGICTLQTVIPTRDDIMLRLMYWGIEPAMAFKIMESVRKGKGLTPEMEETMRAAGVPDWYIWSCKQIKYMFPKAHAAAYVLSALRIAWFKVYMPTLFYAAYFTVRAAGALDADLLVKGEAAVRAYMEQIKQKGKDASPKEKEALVEYEVVLEALLRGIRFLPVDLWRSDAVRFTIEGDKTLRCPFISLPGLGEAAARAIVQAREEAPFQSVEDLRNRARLNKTVMELLQAHGCLKDLPEGNQLSFAL